MAMGGGVLASVGACGSFSHRCSRTVVCTTVHFTTRPLQPAGDDNIHRYVHKHGDVYICMCVCARVCMYMYTRVRFIVALVLLCVLPCTLLPVLCDPQVMILVVRMCI